MEEYDRPYIGDDYPLDKDSLNRLALNDKYLYDKVFIESPRGVSLWKSKTSSTSLLAATGTSPTTLSGFDFTWTPEAGRVYVANFSFRSILTDATGSGNQRMVIAIYLDNKSQNGYITWELGQSIRYGGHLVQAIIYSPEEKESSLQVRYEMVATGAANITMEAAATYPTQFWVEDIGSASTVSRVIQ
jgi:hypothetical protein